VLSLGAPRRFLLKPRGGGSSVALTPIDGDLVVMGGRCQTDWRHCVPKQSRAADVRISINFSSTLQATKPQPADCAALRYWRMDPFTGLRSGRCGAGPSVIRWQTIKNALADRAQLPSLIRRQSIEDELPHGVDMSGGHILQFSAPSGR